MARSNEDELREILDKAAGEISDMYGNPRSWQSWMVYLLGRLEAQATGGTANMDSFKEMLASLQDAIRNRLKTGGW